MQRVKKGDCVIIEYVGTLQNGDVFETTAEVGPLEFKVGESAVLPAFEETVIGMAAGETRTMELPPEQAYGPRREELVQTFERAIFGAAIEPKPGMVLGMTLEREGKSEKVPGLVTEMADGKVTIDFNHPLAGQKLMFTITLQGIAAPAAGND
jgi:peptidylprolyl isomerase